MGALTNEQIKQSYQGLLKTQDNAALEITGVKSIQDGLGNNSALSLSQTELVVTGTTLLQSPGLSAYIAVNPNDSIYFEAPGIAFVSPNITGINTDLTVAQDGANVDLNLTTPDGFTNTAATLVAGTNITLTQTGDNVTIAAAGGSGGLVNGTGLDSLKPADNLLTVDAIASGTCSIAIGNAACAAGAGSTATGNLARAVSNQSLALGNCALACGGNSAIAIGNESKAFNDTGIAIGYLACSNATFTAIAIGSSAFSTASRAVAIGHQAGVSVANAIAIGNNARGCGDSTVAIGCGAVAINGTGHIAIGQNARACQQFGDGGIIIGQNALGVRDGGIVIGRNANCTLGVNDAFRPIAIGQDIAVRCGDSIGIGRAVSITADCTVAIGCNTCGLAANAVALGTGSCASGCRAIAIGGNQSRACTQDSIAIGASASARGLCNIQIGLSSGAGTGYDFLACRVNIGHASCSGACTVVIGHNSVTPSANQDYIVIGHTSCANAIGAVAIGNGVTAALANTVTVKALETCVAGEGLIVKTPDGLSRYKITVDNAGTIVSTLVA